MATVCRTSAALSSLLSSPATCRNALIARSFQTHSLISAIAHPITAHGPPPKAPKPAPEFGEPREEQESATEIHKPQQPQPAKSRQGSLRKRFWKHVNVKKKEEGDFHVLLDTRPLRTPAKEVLSIPRTKSHLAHAIALEWDVMTSAQQALKNHLIPLTSLAARAGDIVREDARGQTATREQIVQIAMQYLDTDTLLCWVPEQHTRPVAGTEAGGETQESLRDIQIRVAKDIISFLSTRVWPGVNIRPILDADSILPVSQPQATKEIIRGWVSGLSPYDLAALERGTIASKSLLVAVRLLVEWSENFRHIQIPGQRKFGIEEAAQASSLEVKWQTDMWGEVEDTHDVDREDLKRQLGSVIVLVSGETN